MVDGSSLTRRNEEQGVPSEGSGERPAIRTILLVIIALVLSGWALHAMSSVFVPLVASVMIALAVMPVRDWVQRRVSRKFRWLGVVAAMALLLLVVGLFFGALWLAAQQVIAQIPGGTGQITQVIEQAMPQEGAEAQGGTEAQPPQGDAGSSLPLGLPSGVAEPSALGQVPQAGQESGGESAGGLASRFGDTLVSVLTRVAKTLLGSAVGIVSALVVIFFLTLLILIESRDWGRKISTITHWRTEWRLTESAEVIAQKVRAYLLIRGVLGLATAALYGLWLWFFGAGLIFVWALLTFLLNFIPTVGSILGTVLPVAFAALQFQALGPVLLTLLGIGSVQVVVGNIVLPRMAGKSLNISLFVTIFSLFFWGALWGVTGMFVALPLTAMILLTLAQFEATRPVAVLLSRTGAVEPPA